MKYALLGTALSFVSLVAFVGCGSTAQGSDASDGGSDVIRADVASEVRVDAGADVVACGATTCGAGQACCAATNTCFDRTCLACCMPGFDAGVDTVDVAIDSPTSDVPADTTRACSSAAECNSGEICVFATAGCSVQGRCAVDVACGRPALPYCGCDGTTFLDHCEGPASHWVSMGACPDAGVDAGVDARMDTGTDVRTVDVGTGADALNDSGGGRCGSGGGCGLGLTCCGGACVNFLNDPLNCGHCGTQCTGSTPMCGGGVCTVDMCTPSCGAGSVCCSVNHAGPIGPPACYVGTTCPVGCPACL